MIFKGPFQPKLLYDSMILRFLISSFVLNSVLWYSRGEGRSRKNLRDSYHYLLFQIIAF